MQMRTICGIISAACAALFIDMAVAVSQEAEWTPYWGNPVAVSPESVKASIYRRGENSLIVV